MTEPKNKKPRRRRRILSLSLRMMMLLVVVIGVPLAWKVNRARAQRRAVDAIRSNGGLVYYDDQFDGQKLIYEQVAGPIRPIFQRYGTEYFREAVYVDQAPSDLAEQSRPFRLRPVATLPRLQVLHLWGGPIDESEYIYLKEMTQLRELNLPLGSTPDLTISYLVPLVNLESLSLFGMLTDSGMQQLSRLTNLRELHLRGARLSDAGLDDLTKLKRLKCLDLIGAQMPQRGLRLLKKLPDLRELHLGESASDDASIAIVAELKDLESLVLYTGWESRMAEGPNARDENEVSRLGDLGLAELSKLKKLKVLSLEDSDISDAGLIQLKAMTRLESLNLEMTSITDAGLVHLYDLSKLRELKLSITQVTPEGVAKLQKALPTVKIEYSGF